ncbi:MAG: hypothetical protein AB1813_20545 [Verrucomicrobiota bacterium]
MSPTILNQLKTVPWTTADWQKLLSVYAEQGSVLADLSLPPMAGHYRIDSKRLHFEPLFPLQHGVNYRAVLQPRHLPGGSVPANAITSVFQLPKRSSVPTTVVRQIYPTADVLPENLLKFYVYFSAPMSRGHIYEHIRLLDDAGKAIELPFLEIDEELWDPTLTRLTLFIDPGRIKRGVRPLEEVGPALEEGKRCTLRIEASWRDGMGNPLRQHFEKHFRVGPPDRDPPDPAQWQITSPKATTKDPLEIQFPEPLDHALAQRLIRVAKSNGDFVKGHAVTLGTENRWSLTPDAPWPSGKFDVVIQTTIEDLAGNNIGKPFEVDLFDGVQKRITNAFVRLPFEIR